MNFINPRGKVFAHIDRIAGWRAGETPAPVTIEWDLSSRCPLGCESCHFAYTHTRGPWTGRSRALPMAYEGVGDLADATLTCIALSDARDMGVKAVVWSGGGEPTTHPSWRSIVEWASVVGLEQGMYSMAGLLTRDSAAHLAKHMSWVVVSLDCHDSASYAAEKGVPPQRFDAACNGIRWMVDAAEPTTVGASFLLHSGNWTKATEMLELARDLGVTYTTFRPTIQTSPDHPNIVTGDRTWITEATDLLEALALEEDVEISPARFYAYRDWTAHGYGTCLGIRLAATITPDGRVWVCTNRRGFDDSCIGDLRVESFKAIWAKHPRAYAVNEGCRVMCRMHAVNETLAAMDEPRMHESFV